jgi:hypothetical protein
MEYEVFKRQPTKEAGPEESYEVYRQEPEQHGLVGTVNPSKIASDLSTLASAGTHLVESAIALPGQISRGLSDLALAGAQKLGGKDFPTEQVRALQEQRQGFPSLETIKSGAQKILPQALTKEPETWPEHVLFNVAGAIPKYMIPGGALKQAATLALGEQLGEEAAKAMGTGPLGQFIGGLFGSGGASVLSSGGRINDLNKYMRKTYDTFAESIPAKGKSSAPLATQYIGQISNQIENGELLPSVGEFLSDKVFKPIKKLSAKGPMSLNELWKRKKIINKYLQDPETPKAAKGILQQLSGTLKTDLINAGQQYPELATKALVEADDIFYGLNNLSPIRRFLRKHITPKKIGATIAAEQVRHAPIAKILQYGGYEPMAINKIMALGVAGRAGTELLESLYKSPYIRRYAGRVAKEASKKIAPATALRASEAMEPQYEVYNK